MDGDHLNRLGRLNSELIILAETAISPQPGEAALNDPSQARDLERSVLSFDDLEFIAVMSPQLTGQFSALMAGISDDDPDVGEREA